MRIWPKSLAILVLFIGTLIYLSAPPFFKEQDRFSSTYIVAYRGNALQLYSAIENDPDSAHLSRIVYDSTTIQNAELLNSKASYDINYEKYEKNGLHDFTWDEVCMFNLTAILYHPLFPHLPSSKSIVKNLEFESVERNVARYVFGLLIPPLSMNYYLHVYCRNIVARVWLNAVQHDTVLSQPLFYVDCEVVNEKKIGIHSSALYLEANNIYLLSILLKTDRKPGAFHFRWSDTESQNNDGSPIETGSSVFRTVHKNKKLFQQVTSQENPFFSVTRRKLTELYESQNNIRRSRIYNLTFIPQKDVVDLLPHCKYSPSYIIPGKLDRYMGPWETHYSFVYPYDETDIPFYHDGVKKPHIMYGNTVLNAETALRIVGLVMKALKKKHGKNYTLKRLLSVEHNPDIVNGDRYLVELELQYNACNRNKTDTNNSDSSNNNNSLRNKMVRFSEYVYQPRGLSSICYPTQFTWNKQADVNYIITFAGRNCWIMHFIDTMSRIYNDTKDPHMNVIIVDFSSPQNTGIIMDYLHASSLPRYTLLKRSGRFHKTLAIQDATATISDPNAIAVQVDLHLTIPSDFTDQVRKHTVQGKMAYSPLLLRLQCGTTPQQPSGFWESEGYGIFSIYKSDWDRIGGMNVQQFRHKWGGEDWELLASVLNHGYEVERLKIKNFNHVFHSKRNMWNSFSNKG